MTDPYGRYPDRPAAPEPYPPAEVEYEVVYPPLSQIPGSAPPWPDPYGGGYGVPAPAAPAPAGGRPQPVTAAAVLAFVEAGLLALGTVIALLLVAGGDGVGAATASALAAVAASALAALLVIGGLALLRRSGRRLVTATTGAELALLGALTLWAVAGLAGAGSGIAAAGVLLAGVAVAALPVVRLVLLARPPAPEWLATAPPPGAPVWSPVSGRWVPARGPGLPGGVLAAVVAPAAVLAVVAAVVVGTSGTGSAGLPLADPYAPGARGGDGYSGYSSWGGRYYSGGEALPAPPRSSHLYDAQYDADARDCSAGDMTSCDSLYWSTPVGDFYEWFGSSCAGRIDHELSGGCVDLLGPDAD
ncbi:hypothetical protein [Trujillonella humicola]|uniref:hypothetical protein n=1 Tax=Trujillonella humicola TaxID=3383699 RepID=UPI0039065BA2